jgi:hypothetical protein
MTTTTPMMVPRTPEPAVDATPAGYHEHDGFMLRLALGFGGASSKWSPKDSSLSDTKISGGGASFSIDLGSSVAENLVLHARIADLVVVSPKFSVDGMTGDTVDDLNYGAVLIAPALTYYFMPINLYLTAAIGFSTITMQSDKASIDKNSKIGFGLNFDVGKEWWVSDNWALGVAGRFWYTTASIDQGGGDSFSSSSGLSNSVDLVYDASFAGAAILFSATYQ